MEGVINNELESFRKEWMKEVRDGPPLPLFNSKPIPTSPVASSSSATILPTSPSRQTTTSQNVEPIVSIPTTAMEFYELAVVAEQQGRLNDALSAYRTAFKLDPDADRSYHLASTKSTLNDNKSTSLPSGDFYFSRTVQLAPDYKDTDHHRSEAQVEKGIGKKSGIVDSNHPSSTGFLLNSLLRSIALNPYVRPAELDHLTPATSSTLGESLTSAAVVPTSTETVFIPEDPTLPLPLASIPPEVLLLILTSLSLSSVIPPPSAPRIVETAPVNRGKKKQRTPQEEMRAIEMELGLEEQMLNREWKSDVEALERLASTCRAARVFTLEDSIWRDLCMRTYVSPQLPPNESALDIVDLHSNDWRRCYIEHPRIRLDGVFISVVTYLRRGESQTAWYSPSHLITYYRYLRFYPSGLVISLQTVESPATIVRKITPSSRLKGITFGKWRLNHLDSSVELWDLEDPALIKSSRKYSFRMECQLGSTARGRMNKLDMKGLQTVRRSDGEVEEIPIRAKPFYFSKVGSYANDEE